MRKKNSLIEFYRFLFAMNIVKNHGYFPYQGKYFSPEHISVEFFFTLSGFLLRRSIDKYLSLPYWKGLFLMLKNKLFALGIPLVVALLVNIPYQFIRGVETFWDFNFWGYLWYVYEMFVVYIFYYTLKRIVRKEKWFFIIAAVICVTFSVLHMLPRFHSWGSFRAYASMSLGVLVSYIPSIRLKKQWLLYIPLTFLWAYVLRILLFDYSLVEEEILNLLVFPGMIYLTFQLAVHNRIFNYLGALSFGLYAYQSVPRLLWILGIGNEWIYFAIILSLAVLTDGIMRIIRYQKIKRQEQQEVQVLH